MLTVYDSTGRGGRWRWLPGVLTVVLVAGAAVVLTLPASDTHPPLFAISVFVAVGLALAGIVTPRCETRRGRLAVTATFVAAGLLWPTSLLPLYAHGVAIRISDYGYSLFWAMAATAILLYPDGRLSRLEKSYVAAAFVLLPGVEPVLDLAGLSYSSPGVQFTVNVVDTCVGIAFVAIVLIKSRRVTGLHRLTLIPVLTAGVVGALTGSAGAPSQLDASPSALSHVLMLQGLVLLGVPVGVVAANLRQQLAYAHIVHELARLHHPATVEDVRAALRRALLDNALDIVYWVPDQMSFVDVTGARVPEPEGSQDRIVVPIRDRNEELVAVIVVDAQLAGHPGLLSATVANSGMALLNARLQSGLRAQAEELRLSQRRIEDARLAERRQLGRDLHDGAQLRLAALTLRLAEVAHLVQDSRLADQMNEAKQEAQGILADLRNIAHGIHPLLAEEGLGAALESLAERQPIGVTVEAPNERFPPAVEAAAYYVGAEALANTLKHAHALRAQVHVAHTEGRLCVDVKDDGVGGAELEGGTGLQGLADRLRMLNGTLTVTSNAGSGTRVQAVIPCA